MYLLLLVVFLMFIVSTLLCLLTICDCRDRTKNMISVACQADLEPISTVVVHPSNELSITIDDIS